MGNHERVYNLMTAYEDIRKTTHGSEQLEYWVGYTYHTYGYPIERDLNKLDTIREIVKNSVGQNDTDTLGKICEVLNR